MSANGQLPNSALSPIGGGYYLANNAARAFNAMSAEARRRWGRPITVVSAYRSYAKQVYLYQLYRSGRGNLAAYPGTSNHGWGLAVDLSPQWSRWAVDQIGARYGFAKRCSDAQSEWWHVVYNPGCTGAGPLPKPGPRAVLRQGMHGSDVRGLQEQLVRVGALPKAKPGHPPAIDGDFGHATKQAVEKFQKQHHLKADGVAGPATRKALKQAVKNRK